LKIILSILAAATAALALNAPRPAFAETPEGAQFAARHCGACHAVGRTGSSPHPAAPVFRRLGQNYDLEKSQEMLEEGTLLATHPDMPSFKLKVGEAEMLFDYLRSIQE
jgi:cytochrome c